jgi:cation diffusion facilitator family transporter
LSTIDRNSAGRDPGLPAALLRRAMSWSVRVGVFLLVAKVTAYTLTRSAAILSDAAESIVHLVAVFFAAYSLRLSSKPPDETHRYGHAKISFFSAGTEGAMILIAAGYIYSESIRKLFHPEALQNLILGIALTVLATVVNGVLGWYLIRVGKAHDSFIVQANGRHTLTDCWTSVAVLFSLVLTALTGVTYVDPVIGILVATNILVTGIKLLRSGFSGLMDTADPETQNAIRQVLDRETQKDAVTYHNLRHRYTGDTHWIEVHLVFPGDVLLSEAHQVATRIEDSLCEAIKPRAHVTTHLESALDHDTLHRGGD